MCLSPFFCPFFLLVDSVHAGSGYNKQICILLPIPLFLFAGKPLFNLLCEWLVSPSADPIPRATAADVSWPHLPGNKVSSGALQLPSETFCPNPSHFLVTAVLLEFWWLTKYQTIPLEPSWIASHGESDGSLLHRWFISTSSNNLLFCLHSPGYILEKKKKILQVIW